MNILLVDDEELQLMRLVSEAKKVFKNDSLFSFDNPLNALKKAKEVEIDIAFLDIEMPGLNGIALAKELKKIHPTTNLIFVTAYNNYAIDAYQLHASGYVLKPVSAESIRREVDGLRYPVKLETKKKIEVKCFGNFEIFYKGTPVKFAYQKSKEVFAYLVDREGALINLNELNAVLWEEDHKSYLRNLIVDIQRTLKSIGCGGVFIKHHNECGIDVSKIDCDAYEYKKGNPTALRMYRGDYMAQYDWAVISEDI